MNRTPLLALLLGSVAGLHAPAFAQADYPNKPVTLVTAFAAGSGPDATLRILAEKLGKAREVSQLFTSVGAGDVAWSLGTLP